MSDSASRPSVFFLCIDCEGLSSGSDSDSGSDPGCGGPRLGGRRWLGGIVRVVGVVVAAAAGGAAEGGLVAALAVVDLALVFEAGEAGLDVVELGGGDHVVGTGGQDGGDLFLRVDDAVGGLGVVGEDLGEGAGLVLFEGVEFFEELDEGLRVVAGLVHVLDAEPVGFGLVHAGELEEAHGDGELGGLVDAVAGPGALGEDDQRDGADLDVVHLGHLTGGVMGADVGGLVGHDAGEFGLFVGGHDEAGVDVEEAAGEGHGVDLVGVDDLDGEGDFAVGVFDDVLADTVDVLNDDGVGDHVSGLLDLHGVLLAGADLPVGGVPVADAAAADVASADGVDVVFAAGLDVGLHVLAGGWEDVGLVFCFDLFRGVFALFWFGVGCRDGLSAGTW